MNYEKPITRLNRFQGAELARLVEGLVFQFGSLYSDVVFSEDMDIAGIDQDGRHPVDEYIYPSLRIRGEHRGMNIAYAAFEKLDDEGENTRVALRIGTEAGVLLSRTGLEPWLAEPHIHNFRVVFGVIPGQILTYITTEELRKNDSEDLTWREYPEVDTALFLAILKKVFDDLT